MRFWPLGQGRIVTSGFGPRDGGFHWGVDFGRPGGSAGMPVYAAQAGEVVMAGPASGFGRWVVVDHPAEAGGGTTVYGHVTPEVSVGDRVVAGQRIAHVNPDRDSNGGVDPHLHLEVHRSVWVPPSPDRLDPLSWLNGAREPVEGDPMELMPYREQMGARLWDDADNSRQVIVQHTTESESGNTNVIGYLERTRKGSYQTMVDFDGEEVRLVPDNRQAWAAMTTGNRIGVHVCAMGRAAWGRERWLQAERLLERTAMRYAEWSRLYGIPLVKLSAADVRAKKRGVCGHVDITYAFRESDHTDPGSEFPYDVVIQRAKALLDPTLEDDMTPDQARMLAEVHRELTQGYPSRSKYRKDDKPVDTLAGMVLNIDGRIHEGHVEAEALKNVKWALDLVKREAAKGDPGALAVLEKIGGAK